MLDEAKELQNNAVKKIISLLPTQKEIVFKAPTGSGKTHMMADLINQILEENDDVIFLVSTLSKGNLAQQTYDKFMGCSNEFKNINPYLISSEFSGEGRLKIPTEYNVYILPTALLKEDSRLDRGAFIDFLDYMTENNPLFLEDWQRRIGKEKKVYLIKDEAHIQTNKINSLISSYFSKVFDVTATPKLSRGQFPDVEIREDEAIQCNLIKRVQYLDNYDEYENLEEALNKFEDIKVKYEQEFGMTPCLMVQISNGQKAVEEMEKIKKCLSKRKSLQWMFIFDQNNSTKCETNHAIKNTSDVKEWIREAKRDESTIGVIIFKQMITEGWDIPRACMLCQIRDTKSDQLKEQVLGRIRRNPMLLDFEKLTDEQKELATTAYVWGNKPKDDKLFHEVKLYGNELDNEIEKEVKIKTTVLKNIVNNEEFDVKNIIENARKKAGSPSIFSLFKEYSKANNNIQELCRNYSSSIKQWIEFIICIDDIKKKITEISTDYSKNMEIARDENGKEIEVSFPINSYYVDANSTTETKINNWIWQRADGNDKFTFDSEAEMKWAKILLKLVNDNDKIIKNVSVGALLNDSKYIVGKNYLANSEIKYEYYLNGIHSSYPDFIMKDYSGRIHIFEVKSTNLSTDSSIEENEYEDKINELKECYKMASKLTGYCFYIPILQGDKWQIHVMLNGEMRTISLEQFEEQLTRQT